MEEKIIEKILAHMFLGEDKVDSKLVKNLSEQSYNNLLLAIIPNLKNIPKSKTASGDEGRVYFLDEDFVVKRYVGSYLSRYNPVDRFGVYAFDKYCSEMKEFWEKGLSVNRYYANVTINQGSDSGLYILQERAKGKILFEENTLEKTFSLLKDFCTKEEFNLALKERKGELYETIVRIFLDNFYETDKALGNVSDSVLENLILSDQDLLNDSRFAYPDIKSDNIIFDGKRYTIIDTAFLSNAHTHSSDEEEYNKIMVMRDMISLFKDNLFAYNFIDTNKALDAKKLKLSDFEMENKLITAKAVKRYVAAVNDLVSPIFRETRVYDIDACKQMLSPVVSKEDLNDILNQLQRG